MKIDSESINSYSKASCFSLGHRNRLLGHRTEPEYVPQIRVAFVVEVVH
jgi:hypothetical protein